LLLEMDRLGFILDATHLCDQTFYQALDVFEGPVWASHSNCRALVDDPRQFSDEQIRLLIERGSVIGGALDAWMIVPNWVRQRSTPEEMGVRLDHLVDHLDHICQLAGNSKHIGIGSDLDGGFGCEQTPIDVRSIADLAGLEGLLSKRGFDQGEVADVLSGNFIRFLRQAWA
jgi:membrane dipeptidase